MSGSMSREQSYFSGITYYLQIKINIKPLSTLIFPADVLSSVTAFCLSVSFWSKRSSLGHLARNADESVAASHVLRSSIS